MNIFISVFPKLWHVLSLINMEYQIQSWFKLMEICQHLLAYLGSFSFLILSEWNYGTGFEDKHVIDIANEVRNILEGKAWALHDRIQENHWLPKLISFLQIRNYNLIFGGRFSNLIVLRCNRICSIISIRHLRFLFLSFFTFTFLVPLPINFTYIYECESIFIHNIS